MVFEMKDNFLHRTLDLRVALSRLQRKICHLIFWRCRATNDLRQLLELVEGDDVTCVVPGIRHDVEARKEDRSYKPNPADEQMKV